MGRSPDRRGTRGAHKEPDQHGMHSLEFRLPDLGEGLTEAEIVHWLVDVGDLVVVDQPVVEVETAKAMVEVPCPYGGVVTARFGEEGEERPVGAPLLTVAVGQATGTDGSGAGSGGRAGPAGRDERAEAAPGAEAGSAADEASGHVLVGYGTSGAQARRRRVRPVSGGRAAATRGPRRADGPRDDRQTAADSPGGRTGGPGTRTDARRHTGAATRAQGGTAAGDGGVPAAGPVPVISPLVRKLAREHGLDLRELAGSGPDGLIMRADVEQAVRAARSAQVASASMLPEKTPPAVPAVPGAEAGAGLRIPLRGVRGAIADKMARSRREVPDATCWVDADASELLGARAAMNAAGGPKISVLALLARICTAALARYPDLNATVDTEAREIVRLDRVHLGFAAQTDRGLVVPVVRDAQGRHAQSLSAEFARLTEAARSGTLTPGDLTGGTFTLNNYGVFGVDGSTPIVNHPEAAMLGVGRITAKPWVHQGELAVRQVVQLSLTFDHRVCDGGTAGGFLRYVADCVEQPVVLLRDL